ncbi:MAG: hypothetical protein KDB07_03640 [Planctomycetes bacterium]|nr:hypothetical protein [Planctomycetota bacterium]
MSSAKSSFPHPIVGFIKFKDEIGLYSSDYESWVLDLRAYCEQNRIESGELAGRKDGRFKKELQCPIRKNDIAELVEWFDKNGAAKADTFAKKLERLDYLKLDENYDATLPVVLYDFDERIAFENPDRNPYIPFDDFLPEGWNYVVVEGFDALVPDDFVYWSPYAARLDHRDESTL